MTSGHDLIWILDNEPNCGPLYKQILGLHYHVRYFTSLSEVRTAFTKSNGDGPHLLITDPEYIKGKLLDGAPSEKGRTTKFPDYLITSRFDDLELMRQYLRNGARDYILKPLRPNELVAKVEKALHQISNREILILRNDLDGIVVNDLTFREHQLLTIFLSRANRSVTRDELYGAIWSKVTVNRKTLDVHIFNLRRKLKSYGYGIVCRDHLFSLQKGGTNGAKGSPNGSGSGGNRH